MACRKISINRLSRQSTLPAFYQEFLATVSLRLNQVYSNVKDRQKWLEVTLATINPPLILVLICCIGVNLGRQLCSSPSNNFASRLVMLMSPQYFGQCCKICTSEYFK